ncbi:MAG: type II secretion system protein [Pirellulales bacterium]|nr:type II secretion system protein [Pirellulales bacterium]
MKSPRLSNADRPGFSFLELQVALILLGIAFAALVPLVVMQQRQLKELERLHDHHTTGDVERTDYVPTTYYLTPVVIQDRTPSAGRWARKLGARAMILASEAEIPASVAPPESTKDMEVKLMWLDTTLDTWRDEKKVQAKVWVKEKEVEP